MNQYYFLIIFTYLPFDFYSCIFNPWSIDIAGGTGQIWGRRRTPGRHYEVMMRVYERVVFLTDDSHKMFRRFKARRKQKLVKVGVEQAIACEVVIGLVGDGNRA